MTSYYSGVFAPQLSVGLCLPLGLRDDLAWDKPAG